MIEDEDEIHPLDRDYSTPREPVVRGGHSYNPELRKLGVRTFAVGLILVFLSAIVLSNFVGNRTVEFFGTIANRLGMVVGLIGGVLIVVAYRWEQMKSLMQATDGVGRLKGSSPFAVLFGMNVAGFAILAGAGYAIQNLRTPMAYYIVVNASTAMLCALMVTLAIRHRGFLQAYAIGVLAPLALNTFSQSSLFFSLSMSSYGGNYGRGGDDMRYMFLVNFGTYLVCGLICGGYVFLLDAAKRREQET